MNDDKILAMLRRIDPETKSLPLGIKEIVLEAIRIEREACAAKAKAMAPNWDGFDIAEAILIRPNGLLK